MNHLSQEPKTGDTTAQYPKRLALFPHLSHTRYVNFLAHLYLAEPTPASMIGNLLPDLAPGPLDPDLSPDVLAGALTHRRVDAFTDTHPSFLQTRARFRSKHGRFSGILTDLFYDHVLARDWARYHNQPLGRFIDQAHEHLTGHDHLMPEPMRPAIARMAEQGWLRCYATPEGMAIILDMMSRRFSQRLNRPIDLTQAVHDLPDIEPGLTHDFQAFFPDLIAHIRSHTRRPTPSKIKPSAGTMHSIPPDNTGGGPVLS